MRISREDLDAYVAAIHEVGEGAATSVRNALQDAHGMGVTEQREQAIAAIMDEIGVSGDRSQALAAELFDEVCALEGIEGAEFEIYDDLIDYGMLESNVRYFAKSLVEHDVGRFLDQCSQLADFYVRRCNYESMVRNCYGNGVRFARVPMGTETCDWCIMLASRGFVYYSQESAEHGVHLGCDCIVVPGVNGQTEIDGYDPDALYDQWRASGFMPPKSPGVRRIAQTPSTGRRSVRHTETGGLTAQQLEAYYARMNAATDVYDLEDEYQNILSEMLSRDSTLQDIDYTRIGDHYAMLRARLLSRA